MYTPSKYQERINGEALYPVDDKRNGCHDVMMKELPPKKTKADENKKIRQKSPVLPEPEAHLQQEVRTTIDKEDECPDILKTRRTYKKEWPRGSLDDECTPDENAVTPRSDTCYAPFPVTKRAALGRPHVQIMSENPEVDCRTREFLAHTPPLPPRSVVGTLGTHVV
ncbi:uncharacterized protein LOC111086921 isoform X2 [Limulus polyphemus]|uniref:Uncharacterized protein LOC111086921 isoform X2 n=1 Tax=Limulus polyphemus TaxID=6850 RepID=A0ABM1SUY2_LIMPO|nr:uncharacterized protein LOC111086921 isoform X2 [Limulus polyphemus]